jgi:hypothetical protein
MTDGTEYQSDPETNKIHYPSRPGSGASTPNSTLRRVPPAPPALPPRSSAGVGATSALVAGTSGLRPPLDRNDSSASHYSDAVDGGKTSVGTGSDAAGVPQDGPPGYGDHAGGPTAYPAEKTDSAIPSYDHSTSTSSAYPVEKRTEPEQAVPGYDYDHASAAPTQPAYTDQPLTGAPPALEEMDEGERREWEQFHADQELAQRAGGLDLNAGQATKDESLR